MFQRLPEPQVEELEKELTLAITGMDCPACTVRVERALKNLGTTSIKVRSLSAVCCYSVFTPRQVDFVGAFASCKYVSGELSAELIRKKVEIASGFRCSISKKRNGQRTLLIRFTAGAPDINKLQLLFGPTQEIQRVSRTDLRFTSTSKSCRDSYDIVTHQN
jgi:Cu2+-exporting ATPase